MSKVYVTKGGSTVIRLPKVGVQMFDGRPVTTGYELALVDGYPQVVKVADLKEVKA